MSSSLTQLLVQDRRYAPEAYAFVMKSLHHAQALLGRLKHKDIQQRHLSAAELLEGVRDLALEQFGLLALPVLNHWGLRTTSDVGEIVYNLIRAEHMSKTDSDKRSDFDDVYNFDDVLHNQFKFDLSDVEL
jgi:uncharacterized repeat protein (TIGR04138 family)